MPLLQLDEAKTLLNISSSNYDDELGDFIDGAEAAVLFICGPVDTTEVTDVVTVTGTEIPLTTTPVLALTSVTGDRTGAVDIDTLRVDSRSGVASVKAGKAALYWDTFEVVYNAGRATPPAAMKQAVKVILKHQWSTLRRSPRGTGSATSEDATFVPGLGYAVPNAALQMLTPYDRGPASG